MQLGKLSHNVLKRSVLKFTTPERTPILSGAFMGNDSSAISMREDGAFVVSANPASVVGVDGIENGFYRCLNDLACQGAKPIALMPIILMPMQAEESQLQETMKRLAGLCQLYGMQIVGGHSSVSPVVTEWIVTLTMIGETDTVVDKERQKAKAGQSLVLTKSIGLEGTGWLARKKKEELCSHYTLAFVEQAEQFLEQLSVLPEAECLHQCGVTVMHNVSEGGILAALWELMERSNTGMEVDLKAIPIRQETVELCEFYRLNPYQMLSNGSLLFATEDGDQMVRKLAECGISATVIGRVSDGKQRILRNEDEERFLDRPKSDELYQVGLML